MSRMMATALSGFPVDPIAGLFAGHARFLKRHDLEGAQEEEALTEHGTKAAEAYSLDFRPPETHLAHRIGEIQDHARRGKDLDALYLCAILITQNPGLSRSTKNFLRNLAIECRDSLIESGIVDRNNFALQALSDTLDLGPIPAAPGATLQALQRPIPQLPAPAPVFH